MYIHISHVYIVSSTHSYDGYVKHPIVRIRIVPPLLQAVAGSFFKKKESVPRCSIDLLRSYYFLRLMIKHKYSTLVELFDTMFWGFDFERINCPILIPHSFSTIHRLLPFWYVVDHNQQLAQNRTGLEI